MRFARRLWMATILLAVACSSSDGVTEPDVTLPQGSMRAKINGSQWQATSSLAVSYQGGLLAFAGSDASLVSIGMAARPVNGPGTYVIGSLEAIGTNGLVTEGGARNWQATTSGSGSITVTTINATGATGTFTFTATAVAATGASGTRVVTEGEFNIKF